MKTVNIQTFVKFIVYFGNLSNRTKIRYRDIPILSNSEIREKYQVKVLVFTFVRWSLLTSEYQNIQVSPNL